jgi:hypothetical protein
MNTSINISRLRLCKASPLPPAPRFSARCLGFSEVWRLGVFWRFRSSNRRFAMAWSFDALGILLGPWSWNALCYAAEVSWDALGVSLDTLGMFLGFFGVFWGVLESFGGVLRMLSCCFWCPVGPPEVFLGCSWNILGCSWAALGMLLESPGYVLNLLGCSWAALGVLLRILQVLLRMLLKIYMGKRLLLGALGCQKRENH